MKLRYLVAVPPERAEQPNDWAAAGEPVVPWYPATTENVFLGTDSFKKATHAMVADLDFDPDALADRLYRQYPGLPHAMHQNYVMATIATAARFNLGTRLRIYITPDTATVQVVGGCETYQLWEKQPIR